MVRYIFELILCVITVAGEPSFLEELYSRTIYGDGKPPFINFISKADEQLGNGKYVFYNKNPSMSLTGYIPRRENNMHVADNLFLRLLPHCGCSRCKFYCGCCSQATLDVLHLDTMACIKVEYLEKDIGFSYSVVVNDEVYVKHKVSVKDPPPVCFQIPTPLPRMRSSACITMYNIEVNGDHRTVNGCIKVSGTLLNMFNSNYDLGCFHMNIKDAFQAQNSSDSFAAKKELDMDQRQLLDKLKEYQINETVFSLNLFNKKTDTSSERTTDDRGDNNLTEVIDFKNQSLQNGDIVPENVLTNSSIQDSIIDNEEYDDTLQQLRRLFVHYESSSTKAPTEEDIDIDQLPFV